MKEITTEKPRLIFYCGITMVKPIKEICSIIEERYNCTIDIISGDSQSLYDRLKKEQKGDLYLPGSISFRKKNLQEGILLDGKYIGFNKAAIFVQRGNPKNIKDLNSLLDDNISTMLCDPKAGSIGNATKKVLKRFGGKAFLRSAFEKAIKIGNNSKELNDALIDKKIDMTINWRATRYWDENQDHIEDIEIDSKYAKKQRMVINLLSFSKHKKIAKALMKFSASPEGQMIIKKYGFYVKLSTEIEAKEAFIRTILDAQPNIIIINDRVRMIDANKRLIEFFDEYDSVEDFRKQHKCICDFFEKDVPSDEYVFDRDYDGLNWIEYILQNPQKNFKVIMKKNSTPHHFLVSAKQEIFDQSTKELFVIIALNDITYEVNSQIELKKLNEELKTKERSIKAILDGQENIVTVTDGAKMIVANDALVKFFDHVDSVEQFKQNYDCICDLFIPNPQKKNYLQKRDYDGHNWLEHILLHPEVDFKVIMNNGREDHHFSVSANKKIINSQGNFIVVATFNDITAEVKAREELQRLNDNLNEIVKEEIEKSRQKDKLLQQQSKLAAMGEMIGAIAHQWRQPLNALAIRIQNLEDDYEEGLIDRKFLNGFIKENMNIIKFMSKTIEDFRNFFAPSKEKQEFDVKTAIQKVVDIQKAQLTNHNIALEIKGESFIINGYESEFKQVILNIINNAKDAIIDDKIENGKITVELNSSIKSIKIKDNANGIPKEIKERIFEPYFTTKEEGKGTGIGLYMSKIIIEKNLGGTLELLDSDEGAVFEIRVDRV